MSAAPIERRAVLVGWVPTTGPKDRGALWLEIEYGSRMNPTKPPELSISGVLGPKRNGDAWGGCGQNRGDLDDVTEYAPGFDAETLRRLGEVWDRWHLNGMNAGTPRQMEHLRHVAARFPDYPTSYYVWAKAELASFGLQPDGKYSYGSAWLYEPVPDDVIEFLRALPEPDRDYPWSVNT